MSKITEGIEKKLGLPGIIDKITERLSLSDLNSFLLELSRKSASKITPAELQKSYEQNRFVGPALIDPLGFMEFELQLLKLAKEKGLVPLELSPVSPLGSCSVVATVDQNKIVSAGRGTEVTADATNSLALECSKMRKEKKFDNTDIHFCTAHRHIRAQQIGNTRGHTAHFKIFCAVTAGKDKGSFDFEKNSLLRHLDFYQTFLKQQCGFDKIILRFRSLNTAEENRLFKAVRDFIQSKLTGFDYEQIEFSQDNHQYYHRLQFKIYLFSNNKEFEIGDGGYVDWTQKLTGNKKERFLISALGMEYLFKIVSGTV